MQRIVDMFGSFYYEQHALLLFLFGLTVLLIEGALVRRRNKIFGVKRTRKEQYKELSKKIRR